MAIKENTLKRLGTSENSLFHQESSTKPTKRFKVLVISENSSDIYMVKKLLVKSEGYIVHEAATLSAALKVINYLSLDLIIVDDRLTVEDGYEVVEKLNHIDVAKEIPKLILLTTDYKTEKKESFHCENVDLVKKPLDSVLFKLRVKLLIQNAQKESDNMGYFRQLSMQKFQEAQNYIHIYQEIFNNSDEMMAIYDIEAGSIVESNAIFEKFFLPLRSFNRIMNNPKLARKFVPFVDEVNYLNYYDPREWMRTVIEGREFSYLIKLHRDFKEYSFNIYVKKIENIGEGVYLIRLSNIYDYLPQKKRENTDTKMQLKESNLDVFKEDFIHLREALWQHHIHDEKVEKLLYSLGTKLSIICEDATIVQEKNLQEKIDIYFMMAQLLKEKFLNRNIYLNGLKVDLALQESAHSLYLNLDGDALYDLVFGLLNNYYGNYFDLSQQHKRLDIDLYEQNTQLVIDLCLDGIDEDEKSSSFMDKIFHKNEAQTDAAVTDALPKNIKQSLLVLNAHIKKVQKEGKSIFTITIPLADS